MRSCKPFIAALALLLAACQPLPRPFMPEEGAKGPKTLAPLADGGGVVVGPVENVPPRVSDALQRAMIDALAAQNITAATGGSNVQSRFLSAAARISAPAKGRGAVEAEVIWTLADHAGKKLGDRTARMAVPRTLWTHPNHHELSPLAAPAAPGLAALMQEPVIAPARQGREIPLHVWTVSGAEGKGGLALRMAMEAALGRRGYKVTETLTENGLVIAGNVKLGDATDGRRPIAVEWAVLDSGGKELGKLDQKNAVPVEALSGDWGGLAYAIAESAAGGIGALLNRLSPGT